MDILNINRNGELKRVDNSLLFLLDDGGKIGIPVTSINIINIYSHIKLNSDLLFFLNKNNVTINFFEPFSGNFFGDFNYTNNKNNAKVLQLQYTKIYNNRFYYIKKLYNNLINNFVEFLKYYQKNLNYGKEITKIIKELKTYQKEIFDLKDELQIIMLFEAKIWNSFYSSIDFIIGNSGFVFDKRTKRPPENEVNSLISFCNTKLYSLITNIMRETQLDPRVGFLHELNGNRYSLSLDLAESFKILFTFKFIVNLINNKKILKSHFQNNFLLTQDGMSLLNQSYNNFLNETVFNEKLKRNISYKYFIKLECYKIIKHIFNDEEFDFFNFKY